MHKLDYIKVNNYVLQQIPINKKTIHIKHISDKRTHSQNMKKKASNQQVNKKQSNSKISKKLEQTSHLVKDTQTVNI